MAGNTRTCATIAELDDVGDQGDRRRLNRLLANVEELAAVAATFEAHRLGDANEIRRAQYVCEAEIARDFPRVYYRLEAAWVQRDVELAHDGVTSRCADCLICSRYEQRVAAIRRMVA